MEKMDGDDGRLHHTNGIVASRDICQFVKFSDYGAVQASRLAADVLREIPKQLTDYFRSQEIAPNPTERDPQMNLPSLGGGTEETKS